MSELSANVPAGAIEVLQAFLDASLRRDKEAMLARVTRGTAESGQLDPSTSPEGVTYVMNEAHMEGDVAVIHVRALPVDAPADAPPAMEMDCLIVQEEGQWKFDLIGTVERMMGGLGTAMEQLTSAMGEAMKGIGEAMADGFKQAFGGETTESVEAGQSWTDAPLTPVAEELLPMPDLTPLPRMQAALSQAVGSAVLAEASVPQLLGQVGGDSEDVLINWFQEQLFGAWADLVAQAAARVPLANRLRAVRIEAAGRTEDRLLALDGSDLVYRIFINHTDGYYSDAEVAAILPGVLAGLPETIDPALVGHRLLPLDNEYPSLDLYRRQVAPRYMRRTCELLGRHVRLEADWETVRDWLAMPRTFWLWGLNRLYGGIALTCQDPSARQRLAADLTTIRLALGYEVPERSARYEGGTLEVGLSGYGVETSGFYEHEIAQVLAGQPTP